MEQTEQNESGIYNRRLIAMGLYFRLSRKSGASRSFDPQATPDAELRDGVVIMA